MNFDGILFFPVTPFDASDRIDTDTSRHAHRTDARARTRRRVPRVRHRRVPRPLCDRGGDGRAGRRRHRRRFGAGHLRSGRAARSRDPGRTSGRRRRCGRLARAAALSGGRHAGRARRVRRGDRRGIRSSRRDLPPRHGAVLGRVGRAARPEPEGRRLQGRRRRHRHRAAHRARRRRDRPRRLRVLQRPADRRADPGARTGHRHPAVFVGGVRDGSRDRERVLPRVRRRRRGAPASRCSTASTRRWSRCATRRPGSASRSSRRGCAAAGCRSAASAPRSSTRRPNRRTASRRSSKQGARCCEHHLGVRRAARAGAAHPALGERCHVGRRDRDARRPLGRRRGVGLLVDPADRRGGRARAARNDIAPLRDRAGCRPRGAVGSALAAPARGGRRRTHDDRPRRARPRAVGCRGARSRRSRSSTCSVGSAPRHARTAAASTSTTHSTSCSPRSAAGSRRASARSRSRSASRTSPKTWIASPPCGSCSDPTAA